MQMSTLFLEDEDPRIRKAALRVTDERELSKLDRMGRLSNEDILDHFAQKMKTDPDFAQEHQDDPRVIQILAREFK